MIIGLFQTVALFPGISRSGATLVGGMYNNLKRETAFKYSFMLYIPISIASMILGIKDLITADNLKSLILPYTLGMIVSIIATYYALTWFKDIIKRQTNILCILLPYYWKFSHNIYVIIDKKKIT